MLSCEGSRATRQNIHTNFIANFLFDKNDILDKIEALEVGTAKVVDLDLNIIGKVVVMFEH